MVDTTDLKAAISLPGAFHFDEVNALSTPRLVQPFNLSPTLGPLAAFTGTWTGSGFNTIFRPQSSSTPTPLPHPAVGPNDNILELNLTSESLAFSPSLGAVPNRGMIQGDIFLNGVPYLQTINDVTSGKAVGIHAEPGIWIIAPSTTQPAEGVTVSRMASIPHGTTINAQGTFSVADGAPSIPKVDITPNLNGGGKVTFPSQTAAATDTFRIPQDLTSFIAAGAITQDLLNDPNLLLRQHLQGQTILKTTTISIASSPAAPLFGGGTSNIAFLLGEAGVPPPRPNAQVTTMTATFWIEEVQHQLHVPVFNPGQPPLKLPSETAHAAGRPATTFLVQPPTAITTPRTITFTSTQIQYSQTVMLNFNGLTWPHVSVATLTPADPITVPPSVWGS